MAYDPFNTRYPGSSRAPATGPQAPPFNRPDAFIWNPARTDNTYIPNANRLTQAINQQDESSPGGSARNGVNRQDAPTGGAGAGPTEPPGSIVDATGGHLRPPLPPNLAPTSAQTAANPSAYAGTSFDPTRSALPPANTGLANTPMQDTTAPDGSVIRGFQPYQGISQDAMNADPLAFVRGLDQVTYAKYVDPWYRQGGDTTNRAAVEDAIRRGIEADRAIGRTSQSTYQWGMPGTQSQPVNLWGS